MNGSHFTTWASWIVQAFCSIFRRGIGAIRTTLFGWHRKNPPGIRSAIGPGDRDRGLQAIREVLTDEDIQALPARFQALFEVSILTTIEHLAEKPPPDRILMVTKLIILGRPGDPRSDLEQEMVNHFSENYERWIVEHGRVLGRWKYWCAVLGSAAIVETFIRIFRK